MVETAPPAVLIRVLGAVRVVRDGAPVPLPRSRKVRALLAFLALEPAPVPRSRLCDLLWDVPSDPRGELRWCLSKLRRVLDTDDRRRVVAGAPDTIALDLSGAVVDAVELARVTSAGVERATRDDLVELSALCGGELLEGEQVDGSPELNGWLAAQRLRHRAMQVAVLRALVDRAVPGSDESFRGLERWLQLAPHDHRAHEVMLEALFRCGRVRDADAHLAATIAAFEQEGLDWSPLREAWRAVRSVAPAVAVASSPPPPAVRAVAPLSVEPSPRRRASVAVMPFVDVAQPGAGPIAEGVTDDIITRLAKLRVLFVIARGTVYALGARGISSHEAGQILHVDYVVSGKVRRHDRRVSVAVELAETTDGRIVWADELAAVGDETFALLDSVVDRIVAVVAEEIETAESQRALLRPPSSLDAWEAYHRGLWHMYRFNGPDNRLAEGFFRSAVKLDPTFARAFAGLSFTHFQNAFLDLATDRDREIDLAFHTAGESMLADDRDPAAHWAMGRALWLRGEQDESLAELHRSIELSPNFALGHYTLGFVLSQRGDPQSAIDATNHSRELSPFDPLQFAMLASRALAHLRRGEHEEAAHWAVKAAARPNAHAHILAIAAECLALSGRRDEARRFIARIRERIPHYNVDDFLRAFRFAADTEALFRRLAGQIGFDRG